MYMYQKKYKNEELPLDILKIWPETRTIVQELLPHFGVT